jgi:hypothetical protein
MPHDSSSRVGFIARSNLRCTKPFGDGYGAVKIIGICGAEARNLALLLRPSNSSMRMCVRDTSNACESTIEKKVSWKVRRWPESALDDFSVKSGNLVARHARRRDGPVRGPRQSAHKIFVALRSEVRIVFIAMDRILSDPGAEWTEDSSGSDEFWIRSIGKRGGFSANTAIKKIEGDSV